MCDLVGNPEDTFCRVVAQIIKTEQSKTAEAESQEESYFPADGHQVMLNKKN